MPGLPYRNAEALQATILDLYRAERFIGECVGAVTIYTSGTSDNESIYFPGDIAKLECEGILDYCEVADILLRRGIIDPLPDTSEIVESGQTASGEVKPGRNRFIVPARQIAGAVGAVSLGILTVLGVAESSQPAVQAPQPAAARFAPTGYERVRIVPLEPNGKIFDGTFSVDVMMADHEEVEQIAHGTYDGEAGRMAIRMAVGKNTIYASIGDQHGMGEIINQKPNRVVITSKTNTVFVFVPIGGTQNSKTSNI